MTKGIGPVPDGLSEGLTDFLNQLRLANIDVLQGRVAALGAVAAGSSSVAPAPSPAGPPGPPGPPAVYVPDLTPPPIVSGVVVSAGIDVVFINTDAPTFSQGHGYNRTLVYGVTYNPTVGGPLPTFGSAVLVHEFVGQVGSFAAEPGTQWHIWLKWRSADAVLSVSPEGGANGHQVTTALIGNANLGPLIIEAANLANGAITTAKFAAGIEPVSIVAALPTALGYTGPKTVLLTTDGKLYRYVAGAWTAAVPVVDLVGQITSTQITDGAISTPKLAAGSVTAATIAANTITANEIAANAITASELAANSVVAGKISAGAVSATEISANAIQAVHLAANSIAVGTAAIQNGAIVNAMIGDATITSAKIANLSASKILAGSIAVGEYIQSSDFVSGTSGWRFGGNTAEVGSTAIRGLLTASQIDTRNLDIRDAGGTVIFSAGVNLSNSRVSGLGAFSTLSQINSGNVSTYIASAAIQDAQIGSLNASKIVAGSITTDKLQVGSASVAAASSTVVTGAALPPATYIQNSIENSVVSLTTTGSPVTIDFQVSFYVQPTTVNASEIRCYFSLVVDGSFPSGSDTPIADVAMTTIESNAAARCTLRNRFRTTTLAAGAHTFGVNMVMMAIRADGGGTNFLGGVFNYTVVGDVTENKV